jgi:hypothetical protein
MSPARQTSERLEDLLHRAGLPADPELAAMHLAEIEPEAGNSLDQLTAFRALARSDEPASAQEALVEVSLALQHLAHHARAVTPMLDEALGIAEG